MLTMKVFRFVEGKVAIACGASEVRDGSCEDSNVKNPHARWYRHFVKVVAALLNVTFCFRKKKKEKEKKSRMPGSVSAAWSSELEPFSFRSWQR